MIPWAAMVGSDHGPPGLSQGQDMLAEKPPPSPRPPIPSPRTPSDLIKVRIICESIGLGRGADNKVGYARLIPVSKSHHDPVSNKVVT